MGVGLAVGKMEVTVRREGLGLLELVCCRLREGIRVCMPGGVESGGTWAVHRGWQGPGVLAVAWQMEEE